MSVDERRTGPGEPQDPWTDLVAGLVDAREDPATARFDAELAAAVEAGEVTSHAAHRLKYWQRVSQRALCEHVTTVLPAALAGLAEAREDARLHTEQAAATLADASRVAAAAAATASPPQPPERPVEPPRPAAPPTAAQQADLRLLSGERRASTEQAHGPSTLEEPATRVLVAELTVLPSALDRTADDRTS